MKSAFLLAGDRNLDAIRIVAKRRASAIRAVLALILLVTISGCGRPRVLHAGLDGATFDVIVPLVEAGFMPTIGALMEDGAWGDLDCVPALPQFRCYCPPVWTSIATGQPYSEHGVLNLHTLSSERNAPAIWDMLHAAGHASVTISYRATHPPRSPLGVVVSEGQLDRAAMDVYATWPASAELPGYDEPSSLFQMLGLSRPDGERRTVHKAMARDRLATDLLIAIERVLWRSPSLSTIVFHSLDKSSHWAWGAIQAESGGPYDEDAIRALARAAVEQGPLFQSGPFGLGTGISQYIELDAMLARILRASDYDYVVLTSDHGMDRNPLPGLSGTHSDSQPAAWNGIFLAAGPGIRPGTRVHDASVLDVAPTLAYLLRLPVSDELPGIVLDLFEDRWRDRHPVRRIESWDGLAEPSGFWWLFGQLLRMDDWRDAGDARG